MFRTTATIDSSFVSKASKTHILSPKETRREELASPIALAHAPCSHSEYPKMLAAHFMPGVSHAVGEAWIPAVEKQVNKEIAEEVSKLIEGFHVPFQHHIEWYKQLADHVYSNRQIDPKCYDYEADKTHPTDVHGNLMRTAPQSSLEAQITALFHDIERCITNKISFKEAPKHVDEVRKLFLHPWHSNKILHTIFAQLDCLERIPEQSLHDIFLFITYHDAGCKGLAEVLPPLHGHSAAPEVAAIANADALDFFRPERLILFFTHPKKPVKDAEIMDRVGMCFKKLNPEGKAFVKEMLSGYTPKSEVEARVIGDVLGKIG